MRCGAELVDELEFPVRPPWHRMGLARVSEDSWLPPVGDPGPVLRAKWRLLGWVPEEVVVVGGAQRSTLDRVAGVLAPHRLDGSPSPMSDAARADLLSTVPNGAARFVSAVMGLVDDVCVMQRRGDTHELVAGAAFFPSRWSLREKVEGSVRAIHGPVPDDGTDMAGRAGRFMARIAPGDIWGRTNWTIHDRPVRWAPRPPIEPRDLGGQDPPRLWLRSEGQTLRALDERVLIFTIRTRLAPVSVFADRPAAAHALRTHVELMPGELAAEKIHPAQRGSLIEYLSRCT